MRIKARIIRLLFLLLISPLSQADTIEEVLDNGLLAEAYYHHGATDKPAIILLHGFLTVHNFNLINNISNELADNDYTVLAPTLTLGISRRKNSMDCSALHLHSLETDLAEIEWWAKWLIRKGHKNIVLMGHSSGALQMIQYAANQRHKEIQLLLVLSVIPLHNTNSESFKKSYQFAINMVKNKKDEIHNFTLAYCAENYAAPPKEYLSYASLDTKQTLKNLRNVKIQKFVIMGSDDIPVYPGWITDIEKTNTHTTIINNADHFYGGNTEFDLYENIISTLKTLKPH